MEQVKRYVRELNRKRVEMVLASDYAALEAERDELLGKCRAAGEELAALRTELEQAKAVIARLPGIADKAEVVYEATAERINDLTAQLTQANEKLATLAVEENWEKRCRAAEKYLNVVIDVCGCNTEENRDRLLLANAEYQAILAATTKKE